MTLRIRKKIVSSQFLWSPCITQDVYFFCISYLIRIQWRTFCEAMIMLVPGTFFAIQINWQFLADIKIWYTTNSSQILYFSNKFLTKFLVPTHIDKETSKMEGL